MTTLTTIDMKRVDTRNWMRYLLAAVVDKQLTARSIRETLVAKGDIVAFGRSDNLDDAIRLLCRLRLLEESDGQFTVTPSGHQRLKLLESQALQRFGR